jgi:hypothetical protein
MKTMMRQVPMFVALCGIGCVTTAPAAESGGVAATGGEMASGLPDHATFVQEVEAHRKLWRERAVSDYVFALDRHAANLPAQEMRLRVVVKGGRVVSAKSLDYHATPAVASIPTLDQLFDRAVESTERADAVYDSFLGYIVALHGQRREHDVHDDVSFDVACFDAASTGCQALRLSTDQCVAAGGASLVSGQNQTCEDGFSIGLIDDDNICCRSLSASVVDEMGDEECTAAGGVQKPCTANELLVGTNHQVRSTCCRRYVE